MLQVLYLLVIGRMLQRFRDFSRQSMPKRAVSAALDARHRSGLRDAKIPARSKETVIFADNQVCKSLILFGWLSGATILPLRSIPDLCGMVAGPGGRSRYRRRRGAVSLLLGARRINAVRGLRHRAGSRRLPVVYDGTRSESL